MGQSATERPQIQFGDGKGRGKDSLMRPLFLVTERGAVWVPKSTHQVGNLSLSLSPGATRVAAAATNLTATPS